MDLLWQFSRDSWGLFPLLIVFCLVGLAIILERCAYFRFRVTPARDLEMRLQALSTQDRAGVESLAKTVANTPQSELLLASLPVWGKSEDDIDQVLEEHLMVTMPLLDKRLWVLDSLITLGPLLGLLGTILHLMQAFSILSSQTALSVSALTGPIAHALVATAVGLLVAIIGVVGLNYFQKRVRLLQHQLDTLKLMLIRRAADPT